MKYVKSLAKISKKDLEIVGGKGANLGEMIKNDFLVPQGFVIITDAYQRFINDNKIIKEIDNLDLALKNNHVEDLEKLSGKIKSAFELGEIPQEIKIEIEFILKELNMTNVAIRSSSTAEDLPGISFAGQYSTYLNISEKEEIFKYIKKCWASLWNSRAVLYRAKQNISNKDIGHSVVVQQMINSEKSGILFTANPVNGRRDEVLINSSWGLGEAIVSGEVSPDQWVMSKDGSVKEELISEKKLMTVRTEKGINLVNTPFEKVKEKTLKISELNELLNIATNIEKYFGDHQDIEWAYQNGQFYIVQSRPITSLYPIPNDLEKNKDLRIYININNYSQAMKEPFTPMGESVVKAMMKSGATNLGIDTNMWWYKNLAGRIFIDITDFMRTEKSWDKFKKEDPNDKDPMTTKALLQLLERNKNEILDKKRQVKLVRFLNYKMSKYLINTGVKFLYGKISPKKAREKAVKLCEDTINNFERGRLGLKTIDEKIDYIENNISKVLLDGFGVVFYVAISSTYMEKAKKIMEQCLEDSSDLLVVEKSVPYSVTTEMGMNILNLAKLFHEKGKKPNEKDLEIKKFMKIYGHRSSIELDVGVPSWKDEPKYVIDLINSYIESKTYDEGIKSFQQGKLNAERAIKKIRLDFEAVGKSKEGRKVEKMLIAFREMFGIREQSKFLVTSILDIVRDMLIDIGEELVEKGFIQDKYDVFYITLDDLKREEGLKEIVSFNKEKFNLDFQKRAPKLITSTGESMYFPKEKTNGNSLSGIPVSPGIFTGRVVVLSSPEEGHILKNGDILVTEGTNPAWTPLFLKIGGLIMETGGSISHGSVVAREYGLPAVAGVIDATRKLKNGQIVKVNGETGFVELISQ